MKKTNEKPSRRGFLAYMLITLGFTATGMLSTGCPAGTKTAVEVGAQVTVSSDGCKEDRISRDALKVPPDLAILDCVSATGGGTVRILFPRKAWHSIRQDGLGAIDVGPGK